MAKEEQFEIPVQINGRLRSKIRVEDGLSDDEVLEKAKRDPRIAQLLLQGSIVKEIVVPRKLVNFVIR